jgi:hypothetical protein
MPFSASLECERRGQCGAYADSAPKSLENGNARKLTLVPLV